MKRNLLTALATVLIVLRVTMVQAATVVWNGVDPVWEQPDTNSWSATYNSGDTVQFAGAGAGTITVDSGGVTPAQMIFTGTAVNYTFEGGTIGGAANKLTAFNNGTITLGNTNTYGGITAVYNNTKVVFRGNESVPSGTLFQMLSDGEHRFNSQMISFLMDDAGTVNLGNEVEMTGAGSYEYGTAVYTINVDNNGGATTGSTIALGKMDFTNTGGNQNTARLLRSTGGNGYRLQFGDVDLNWFFNGTMDGKYTGPQGFYSDTAPITIAGTVKQINGTTAATDAANGVFLGGTGTTTTNYVTGTIKDADDYVNASNPYAKPLFVRLGGSASENVPVSDAVWVLSSSNSYSGGTEVRNGTLIADAANALGYGDVTIALTTGKLILNAADATGASAIMRLPSASTPYLTLNADNSVARLQVAGTEYAPGEYTSSESFLAGSGTLTVGALPLYWDTNGSTGGAGGATPNGTWDGTTANWNSVADGTGATTTWGAGSAALFAAGSDATGSYTVTVDGTRDIASLWFEEGDVTLSGGTLRMLGSTPMSIAAGSTITVDSVISDDGNALLLDKFGAGSLELGAANTLSGTLNFGGGGTLTLSHSNAVTACSDVLVGGDLVAAVDADISKLNITGDGATASGGALDVTDTLAVSGANGTVSNDLNFATGAVLYGASNASVADTLTIVGAISGSPDVPIAKSNYGLTDPRCKRVRFEPSGNTTQTLGQIQFTMGGGSQHHILELAGDSEGNTIESVVAPNFSYGQHIHMKGPGKWTINGNITDNTYPIWVQVEGGTLTVNGSHPYPGPYSVENGRLAGDFTYGPAGGDSTGSVTVKGGGILSPGDGGIGKMTFEWAATTANVALNMQDNSIYEYDVSATTNDVIHMGGENYSTYTETLNLDNFILKIQDAGGGMPSASDKLTVFTYDAWVTVDMSGFGNTAANFDTSAVSGWDASGASLVDNTTGMIYLTGLVSSPPGTLILLR